MTPPTIFDLESAPEPQSVLDAVMPEFEPPSNYVKPEAIAANIAKQKADWLERAALSAVTGRIVAIGYVNKDGPDMHFSDDEKELLQDFWAFFGADSKLWVGFNIMGFDLPFIARRSWKHGIKIPKQAREGRYWSNQFVDLMDVWRLGNRDQTISLDNLSKFMGLSGTVGSGKDFATMSRADQEAHLEADLRMTAAISERIL